MTPKEKARELVDKMRLNGDWGEKSQGECIDAALIAVDEILILFYRLTDEHKYWEQVKTEIEKL